MRARPKPTPEEHLIARKAIVECATDLGFVPVDLDLPQGALAAVARYVGTSRQRVSQWWTGARRMVDPEAALTPREGAQKPRPPKVPRKLPVPTSALPPTQYASACEATPTISAATLDRAISAGITDA